MIDDRQHGLPIKSPMEAVEDAVIRRQPTMTAAILLCQQLAGVEDKELCGKHGIVPDPAVWSRIKVGAANFPQDRLPEFMDFCGNEAPLLWLARRRGYLLTPMETELERRLRIGEEERERLQRENALLRDLLQGKAS